MTGKQKTAAILLGSAVLILGMLVTLESLRRTHHADLANSLTQAIEQLRSEQVDIRVGGIYALEQIGWHTEQHTQQVVEILSAFVRERARWSDHDGQGSLLPFPRRAPDIQAALTVLGRHRRPEPEGQAPRLDLADTDLRGAQLGSAHLEGTILSGAHLEGANLTHAHLQGAILRATHLERANLQGADLDGAFLGEANLTGAVLNDASAEGAFLMRARLDGAQLLGTNFQGAFGLTWDQVKIAFRDQQTRLPKELSIGGPAKQVEGVSER